MTEMEEIIAVKENGDDKSFSSLKKKHVGICVRTITDYSGTLAASGYNVNDIYEETDKIIFDAINSYDETKGAQFNTWLGNHTRYCCLNYINKRNKECRTIYSEEYRSFLETISNDEEEVFNPEIIKQILDTIKDYEDKRAWQIFYLKYYKKKTWAEIGKEINLSHEGARQIHNKVVIFVKERISTEE